MTGHLLIPAFYNADRFFPMKNKEFIITIIYNVVEVIITEKYNIVISLSCSWLFYAVITARVCRKQQPRKRRPTT